jgi:hypothetical protein
MRLALACFFRPKACYYPPFVMTPLEQQPSIGGWEVATCSPAASPPKPPHVFRRSVLRTEFNADGGGGFLSYRHPAHAAPRGVHMSLGEARAAPGT